MFAWFRKQKLDFVATFNPKIQPGYRTMQDYPAGRLYAEAEALRKAGRIQEAEEKYKASIAAGKKDRNWVQYGPAPAMFEALAKLYYHTNRDREALAILDEYLGWVKQFGKEDTEMELLRERMASGKFRRRKY